MNEACQLISAIELKFKDTHEIKLQFYDKMKKKVFCLTYKN